MKNFKTFFILIIGLGLINVLQAQNPIPSYNILVDQMANFQENVKANQIKKSNKGERTLKVVVKRKTDQDLCQAIVKVYSLDEQDVLGPYNVVCEELLSVEIDEREWGVMVQSDDNVYADVWIEEGGLKGGGDDLIP